MTDATRGMPPPGSPDAPKYWMDETGGLLAIAVENYLNHRPMSAQDIALMRAYLCQWIDSPAWDLSPTTDEDRAELADVRRLAKAIANRRDVAYWLMRAEEMGIDPL